MRTSVPWIALLWIAPRLAAAQGSDPGAARVQLQQGYTLKQQGKCTDAIPYFQESIRLDRHPKAILNLADCESKLGKLVSAQTHLVEARDLARSRGMNDYEALATKQLATLEPRLPKLVVQLAKDAPADSVVVRDGVELGKLSLGTQLPLDPGAHEIVVRAGGQERRYPLTLAESEAKTIEVTGPVVSKTAAETGDAKKPPTDEGTKPASSAESPESAGTTQGLGTQRIAALITGGAGVVAMGISLALISSAKSAWQEAADRCPNNQCDDPNDIEAADAARTRGNVATGVFLAGSAAAITGGILWFTAPSMRGTALSVTPLIGTSSGGLLVRGSY